MTSRPAAAKIESSVSRRLEAFTSIAAQIAHAPDLDGVLSVTLDETLRALALEVGGVYLLDEHTGELRVTPHHRGVPSDYPGAVSRFQRGEAHMGRALEGDKPVVVHDLSATPEAREATGLRSFAFVPLHVRGRAVGVMALGGYTVRDFPPEDLRLLEAIGGMLGGAVENARLLVGARRHLAQVQALWEIDRALAEDRDLGETLSTIAREAGVLGGGDTVIALAEPTAELRIASVYGERALSALGTPLALAGTPLATLLLTAAPQSLCVRTAEGPARALVVPLRAGERTLGGLLVVKTEEDVRDDDLTILSTFGHQAAVALAKARVRDAEDRRAGQLALVSGASEIAASTLDLDALLGSITRYIQRSFGYYSVAVYLVEPLEREAFLAGAAGAATIMPKRDRLRFGAGIIGWVAEHGEYVLANDVRREPRFVPAKMEATLAELAVPVKLSGSVVAVINVESDRVGAFDEGDLVAVDAVAAQVASAIRNARLFDEKVRTLRGLEILQEITNVLNSDLDLDALLDRIARRSVEAVRTAQMGAVLLYDGDRLTVRSSYGYPNPAALGQVRMAFHEGLPGSVFVSGQGRVVAPGDLGQQAASFREAAGGAEPKSALCVPISLPQEKLGVLLLENFTTAAAFDADHLRFATTLAHQAAIAMGNALRLRKILELDRQRQSYLSNVSHELRTPLTIIQGYLEALADGTAGDQIEPFARVAYDQCQRLGRMIDEILEVSRLERGVAQRHLEWSPVVLSTILRKVIQVLRQEALFKGLTLSEVVPEELPAVPGDERLLHLLLHNLVENAVKFTPRGGHVEVRFHSSGDEAVLTVTDDGIGIPEELRERVFEKFFMVDAGPTRVQGGAGIGLYLAKEVVAIHSGAIRVDCPPSGGSRFEVRLPLRPLH